VLLPGLVRPLLYFKVVSAMWALYSGWLERAPDKGEVRWFKSTRPTISNHHKYAPIFTFFPPFSGTSSKNRFFLSTVWSTSRLAGWHYTPGLDPSGGSPKTAERGFRLRSEEPMPVTSPKETWKAVHYLQDLCKERECSFL